ncbi:MAG: flagellar hook-basal body complex protein FliE [Nitrospirae bacterium]|nr:flagellar hook-basal body complex protein FliE [Nitrospirota bacterium]MBI3594073.1 flagellar hook-basal body complex protein FliE [Nitrospirota bacterium]
MDIQNIGLPSVASNPALPSPVSPGAAKGEPGFLETLKESIQMVNEAQLNADQAVTNFETGKEQNLHQTMIALQKADISFELMMQVRNKIVNAYQEISKMQI